MKRACEPGRQSGARRAPPPLREFAATNPTLPVANIACRFIERQSYNEGIRVKLHELTNAAESTHVVDGAVMAATRRQQ
jgi:hypothetical protein